MCMGKWASIMLRPAIKWALNVWIALSAALHLWMWGGTSWYCMFYFRGNYFNAVEAIIHHLEFGAESSICKLFV
jgi:hypothetical protein